MSTASTESIAERSPKKSNQVDDERENCVSLLFAHKFSVATNKNTVHFKNKNKC